MRLIDVFKLLHGSLQQYISASSRASLEKTLEQFFTPWAWKWDVDVLSDHSTSLSPDSLDDNGPDFSSYLGIPLHSTTPSQTKARSLVLPILDRIYASAPPSTSPALLCLQPPSVFLPPAQQGAPSIPPSLPRYLLSTIQLPPELRRRPRRASVASTATLRSPPRNHKQAASIAGSTAASFIPRLNQGLETVAGVANPKKWGWPGFLTFGRSEGSSVAPSRDTSPSRAPRDPVSASATDSESAEKEEGQDPAATVPPTPGDETEVPSRNGVQESNDSGGARTEQDHPDHHPEATTDIDQSLLEDAIKDVVDAIRIVASSEPEPTGEHPCKGEPTITQDDQGDGAAPEVPSGVATPPPEIDKPIPTTDITVTSPPDELSSFTNMTIHIDVHGEDDDTPSLKTTKLSYLTV